MPREYHHMEKYERELDELKRQGKTYREIGEQFGFSPKQVENCITRYRRKQAMFNAGIAPRKKGRPVKDHAVTEETKAAELKYILARKDAKIKRLEMENELMRDFLSLTERK